MYTYVQHNLLAVWKDDKGHLLTWYGVVMDLALIQPSSDSSSERMLSILRSCMEKYTSTMCSRRKHIVMALSRLPSSSTTEEQDN